MGTIKIFLERLKSELQKLRSRRVEGLLVASAHNAQARDWKRAFANLVVPVIFIDRRFPRIPFVGGDDEEIGLQATTHLAEQGYRRIAHICGPHTVATATGRRKGYLKALKKLSLRLVPEFIIESKYHDTGLQIPERFGLIGVGGHQVQQVSTGAIEHGGSTAFSDRAGCRAAHAGVYQRNGCWSCEADSCRAPSCDSRIVLPVATSRTELRIVGGAFANCATQELRERVGGFR